MSTGREGMATLRLFANLRETAGAGAVQIDGATVGEVLREATSRYGERFAAGLETAQVWVNGDPADDATPVAASDEIAVIPPVSGGAVTGRTETDLVAGGLILAMFAILVVGNLAPGGEEAFAVAVVGVTIAWLWDLRDAFAARGGFVRIIPAMLAVAAAVNGAYRWGATGLAGGVAVGIGILLAWAVLDPAQRSVDSLAVAVMAGLTGAAGAGALMLLRLSSPAEAATALSVGAAAAVAVWTTSRSTSTTGGIDPSVAALLAAGLSGAVAGWAADTIELVNSLIAATIAAGGFIAGRTIGAAIRMGTILHTVRAPGLMTVFDGPILMMAIFWIAIRLVS